MINKAKVWRLTDVAKLVNANIVGDANIDIEGLASLQAASKKQLSFYKDPRFLPQLQTTQAAAVMLHADAVQDCPVTSLVVDDPYQAFVMIAELVYQPPLDYQGIHPTVIMGKNCQIGVDVNIAANCVLGDDVVVEAGVTLGPNCVLGNGCHIGENSRFYANVTCYYDVFIGKRAIIHSGVVLGSDGFGNYRSATGWRKVPQLGTVRIGNDVEIGANSTVDRGALDDTIIEDGVKLDDLVMIAHNVKVGAHTAMAGYAGAAGSAVIGKHCMIGGRTSISGHIKIADNVVFTGTSMVPQSITKAGIYSSGTGLLPLPEWRKCIARLRHLDRDMRRIFKAVRKIEKQSLQEEE